MLIYFIYYYLFIFTFFCYYYIHLVRRHGNYLESALRLPDFSAVPTGLVQGLVGGTLSPRGLKKKPGTEVSVSTRVPVVSCCFLEGALCARSGSLMLVDM